MKIKKMKNDRIYNYRNFIYIFILCFIFLVACFGFTNEVKADTSLRVYQNTQQTIAKSTYSVKVNFDTKQWDEENEFSTSTGIFTATDNGYYMLCTGIVLQTITDAKRVDLIMKINGVSKLINANYAVPTLGNDYQIMGCDLLSLSSSDQVQIDIYHNDSSDKTLWNDSRGTWLSIIKIPSSSEATGGLDEQDVINIINNEMSTTTQLLNDLPNLHEFLFVNMWLLFCLSFIPLGVIFGLFRYKTRNS